MKRATGIHDAVTDRPEPIPRHDDPAAYYAWLGTKVAAIDGETRRNGDRLEEVYFEVLRKLEHARISHERLEGILGRPADAETGMPARGLVAHSDAVRHDLDALVRAMGEDPNEALSSEGSGLLRSVSLLMREHTQRSRAGVGLAVAGGGATAAVLELVRFAIEVLK